MAPPEEARGQRQALLLLPAAMAQLGLAWLVLGSQCFPFGFVPVSSLCKGVTAISD